MKCAYCGKSYPDNLYECPNCSAGNPNPKPKAEGNVTNNVININVTNVTAPRSSSPPKPSYCKVCGSPIPSGCIYCSEHTLDYEKEAKRTRTLMFAFPLLTALVHTIILNPDAIPVVFMLLYVVEFVGNLILLAILEALECKYATKVIWCVIFMIIGCMMSHMIGDFFSYQDDKSAATQYTKPYNTTLAKERDNAVAALKDGVPCNGMTLEELQSLNWGTLKLKKCRDFDHLRVEARYYEAEWYNSKGERIGSGLILFNSNDESDNRLVDFRNYTEKKE